MDAPGRTESRPQETRYIAWCCCPSGRFGANLFGALLIVGGGAWLLHNLGVLPGGWEEVFWPALLIGVGVAYLFWGRRIAP